MYHCSLEDKETVVIASDTDILILMAHLFASRLSDHKWFLQTKKNQFVNVCKIHEYIGNAIEITLLIEIEIKYQLKSIEIKYSLLGLPVEVTHCVTAREEESFFLTGCDTVSYFYWKCKNAILEQVLKQEVLVVELLSDLGEHTHLSETSEEKLKRFVQIFVCGMYVLVYVLIFYLRLSRSSH